MTASIRVLSSVFTASVLVAGLSGCGATAPDRASVPRHQWSDNEWYAQAIDVAYATYEGEVSESTRRPFYSSHEAEQVARHLSVRFDAHLDAALHRYGLTRRGLALHAERHPEFARDQTQISVARMSEIQRTIARRTAVDEAVIDIAALDFVTPVTTAPSQLASR